MYTVNDSVLSIRTYPAKHQKHRNTICLYHGWGSSVTKYDEFARMLSGKGFTVIVPELIFHDSRNALGAYFDQGIVEQHFWEIVFQSIEESDTLIKQLNIPKENIIWLGVSMGGFIASGAAAKQQGSAGLININGSGSFLFAEQLLRSRDKRTTLSISEQQRLRKYDPLSQEQVTPTLLLHGEDDEVIPISTQQHYADSTNNDVTFLKYPNINHTVSDDMIADILNWLDERF